MKTVLWSALLLGLLAISQGQSVKPAIVNGQDAPRGRHVPRTRLVVHAAVRSTSLFCALMEGQGGKRAIPHDAHCQPTATAQPCPAPGSPAVGPSPSTWHDAPTYIRFPAKPARLQVPLHGPAARRRQPHLSLLRRHPDPPSNRPHRRPRKHANAKALHASPLCTAPQGDACVQLNASCIARPSAQLGRDSSAGVARAV